MPPKQFTKNQQFKRERVRNARQIRSEASSANPGEFSESGSVLNIPSFVSSREYEIKQLQQSIHSSKQSSSTRVFQALPRSLRRRTASHNVKRIPKRLRNKALKEMQKSQQQFTQGTRHLFEKRKHGLSSRKIYRAKMMVNLLRLASKANSMKLRLPENLTAGNRQLRSKIRLLQKQLRNSKSEKISQLNNQLGSYDSTGHNKPASRPIGRAKYMKRQKDFVWLPTHLWNAKRSHMFKRWGFHLPWSPTQKNFRLTHRLTANVASSNGAMACDTSYMGNMIVSCSDHEKLKDVIKQLTDGRACLPKYLKRQLFKGLLYLGTECVGPCNVLWFNPKCVLIRLHPSVYLQVFSNLVSSLNLKEFSIQDCQFSLGSITISGGKSLYALSQILRSTSDSTSYKQFQKISRITDSTVLPEKTMFAFEAMDPRFLSNPKPCSHSTPISTEHLLTFSDQLPETELSEVLCKLASSSGRNNSYNNQQTLKQLARRRRDLRTDLNNRNMIPLKETDSRIPLLLMRESQHWVLILPWFWVLPFWYQLNKVSGVYHMGLKQFQQQSFEQKTLNFPDDYPFTAIGYDEDTLYKSEVLHNLWSRKPEAKRINYVKLGTLHKETIIKGELGLWFSCDWNLLRIFQNGLKSKGFRENDFADQNRTSTFNIDSGVMKIQYIVDLLKLYEKNKQELSCPVELYNGKVQEINEECVATSKLPIVPISCSIIQRGHPKDHARIYKIPDADKSYWREIASGTYKSNGKLQHDTKQPVPHCYDLIGFLTSASFHLSDGKGIGTGFISAYSLESLTDHYVLIRNCGETTYRLATWERISV
ncbi:Pop1 [Kluyveromyces lactis]|nr:Pop1 [Kluyveromyces lactis]